MIAAIRTAAVIGCPDTAVIRISAGMAAREGPDGAG
jgi:hypothetical protein